MTVQDRGNLWWGKVVFQKVPEGLRVEHLYVRKAGNHDGGAVVRVSSVVSGWLV